MSGVLEIPTVSPFFYTLKDNSTVKVAAMNLSDLPASGNAYLKLALKIYQGKENSIPNLKIEGETGREATINRFRFISLLCDYAIARLSPTEEKSPAENKSSSADIKGAYWLKAEAERLGKIILTKEKHSRSRLAAIDTQIDKLQAKQLSLRPRALLRVIAEEQLFFKERPAKRRKVEEEKPAPSLAPINPIRN